MAETLPIPALYSVAQAAHVLGLSKDYVRLLCLRGTIVAQKVGKLGYVIPRSEVEAYFNVRKALGMRLPMD